jgi:hypothetical protein
VWKEKKERAKKDRRKNKGEVERGCVVDCVTQSLIFVTQVGGGSRQQVLNRLHTLFQYHILPWTATYSLTKIWNRTSHLISFQSLNQRFGYATLAHSRSLRTGKNLGKQEVRLCVSIKIFYSTFSCNILTWKDLIRVFVVAIVVLKKPLFHEMSSRKYKLLCCKPWKGCSMNVVQSQTVGFDINMFLLLHTSRTVWKTPSMVLPHILCSKEEVLLGVALSPMCVSVLNTYKWSLQSLWSLWYKKFRLHPLGWFEYTEICWERRPQSSYCLGRPMWLYFWCTSCLGCTKSTLSCNEIIWLCSDMVKRCARKSACVRERSYQHMGWNEASYAKKIFSIIFSS